MSLVRLQVENVRNVERLDLELGGEANLIVGPNGSGKTTLLEAIHLLSLGRSFRSGRAGGLIRYGSPSLTVFGVVRTDGFQHSVGFSRGRDGTREFRVNGETQRRVSEVARLLPVQVLGPRTVDLIQEGPDLRRRFLNWGVFHVKPAFQSVWTAAERSLRHRNLLLRQDRAVDPSEFASWERQLAEHSVALDGMRRSYLEQFEPVLARVLLELEFGAEVSLEYLRGWAAPSSDGDRESQRSTSEPENEGAGGPLREPDEQPSEGAQALEALLAESRGADLQRGFSTMGYHRAELRVRADQHPAADFLSRGQMKLLAWAMTIAQGHVLREAAGRSAVYLADDMSAELDGDNTRRVCGLLAAADVQCIATGLRDTDWSNAWPGGSIRTFRIDSGKVSVAD